MQIGSTLKRRREWARLTQQELVDHTRLDRSASYVSAIETGRTSPTLAELEQLARYFRLTVIDLLQETLDESQRRGAATRPEASPQEERLQREFGALSEADQDLVLDFIGLLARRRSP